MKRRLWMSWIVTVCFLMSCGPLFAHHGYAGYNLNHPITLKGTVTQFLWANPHVQIYFDAKDDNGTVTHWSAETLSPAKLVKYGWAKDVIRPGDAFEITLDPAKNGAPVGLFRRVVFADGRELLSGQQ